MDEKGRSLAQSVWTRMDRKAGAITELTIPYTAYSFASEGPKGPLSGELYEWPCIK